MQEFLDQQFDAEAGRKLKVVVSPRQQQDARERLLRRAAAQPMLPPLVAAEASGPRDYARLMGARLLRVLHFVVLDSTAYERARRPPRFYQYYNAHGHYAFSIIHMSA